MAKRAVEADSTADNLSAKISLRKGCGQKSLVKRAIAIDEQKKKEAEVHKIRVNKKGAGRSKNLSADEEICLTLFYLRQMPIFEVLGMMERSGSNNG